MRLQTTSEPTAPATTLTSTRANAPRTTKSCDHIVPSGASWVIHRISESSQATTIVSTFDPFGHGSSVCITEEMQNAKPRIQNAESKRVRPVTWYGHQHVGSF